MNKKQILDLLARALDELQNLEKKVAAKEVAGWEGVRRRCALKLEINDTIRLLSYDVS